MRDATVLHRFPASDILVSMEAVEASKSFIC